MDAQLQTEKRRASRSAGPPPQQRALPAPQQLALPAPEQLALPAPERLALPAPEPEPEPEPMTLRKSKVKASRVNPVSCHCAAPGRPYENRNAGQSLLCACISILTIHLHAVGTQTASVRS
jgi:hypothetical protein